MVIELFCSLEKQRFVFGRLLLIFILIPLVELVLLHQLYIHTHVLTTILVVMITGIVGVNLARRQGMQAWRGIHQQMATGQTPSKEILNGVMILLAGAFLITPGLLTDAVGFSLLVPKVRLWLGERLMVWFRNKTISTFSVKSWPPSGFEVSPEDEPAEASVRLVEPRKIRTVNDAD